ncbi:thiamine-triphosphatase isoform X2 [Sceloporus undulatus]|uniref:thiamine-triphosphatase isoform X2 n=1 Tax=Sceloporus undulatus TaxID=8520 RepID=UPI001C4C9D27|nr:thiamine-triphosphatase isoform X2 [Sceloporus undulatus]
MIRSISPLSFSFSSWFRPAAAKAPGSRSSSRQWTASTWNPTPLPNPRRQGRVSPLVPPHRRGLGAQEPPPECSGLIEVEQKFLFSAGTAEKLATLGGTLQSDYSFRDQYYDVMDLRLTLADHWLRHRQGAGWELKCPPQPLKGARGPGCAIESPAIESLRPQGRHQAPTGGHADTGDQLQPLESLGQTHAAVQYLEVTCPRDIVNRICGLLGVEPATVWHENVARAVEDLGLQEFASFVTRRCQYRLGDLNVDLDEADFGYAVGEVEAMVKRQEEIPAALESIRKLGIQLGFDERTRNPGKMSAYLYKFRPAHYEALFLPSLGSTLE